LRFFFRTGRRKRGTAHADDVPVENLNATTPQQCIADCENQAPDCQSAAETSAVEKVQEQSKPADRTFHRATGDEKHVINTSDEYRSSGGHVRRTGNKNARGRDMRHTDAVATAARQKAKARSGGNRMSEITQRTVRNDSQQSAANQPVGPMITRTIYTSDKRTRSGGDQANERSSLSNTVAVTTG